MELDGVLQALLPHNGSRYVKEEVYVAGLNSTDGGFLQSEPEISILYLVCIGLSSVIGLVGNILVIGAVTVHKKLRTTGNVFIVNLALADLVVVTIVQPFNVIGIVNGPIFFLQRRTVCHIVATVCVMSCANSMMTLAAIALNRYIFVCKNKYYRKIFNRCTTPLLCICLWMMVFLIDLPNYLGWGDHTFDTKTMGCSFDRLSSLSYTLFLSIVIYWVPFCLVFVCYFLIYKHVKHNRRELQRTFSRMSGSNNDALLQVRREENIRMVRTFFIVVIVFLICWTPYDLLVLFDRNDKGPKLLYVILLAIGHSNSSLNWILYGTLNRRFRKGYLEFLCLLNVCSEKKFHDYFNSTKRYPHSGKHIVSDCGSSGHQQSYNIHKHEYNERLDADQVEPSLVKFNHNHRC